MDYIIKFDNREKDLIKILELKEYNMTLENLDIGDIQFVDLKTKEIMIVIERKTYSDLSASIKDGRYKEQKERLIHSLKNSCRKIILIEGTDKTTFSLPVSTISSIIINTLIRDNIHIYMSDDKNSTIEFIENIILQLPKYYEDLQKEIIHGEIKLFQNEHNCNTFKKDNLTQEVCFRNMLAQIPGVSISIASVYVNKYKNMESFINKLKENNNNKDNIITLLASEKHGKNNRKVGEKLSQKIYNYIFNNSNEIINNILLENNNKNYKSNSVYGFSI
jgi:crossover junction endonuclease MUS81